MANEPSREELDRMLKDAFKHSKLINTKLSYEEQIVARYKEIELKAIGIGRSILRADPGKYNRDAMLMTIHKVILEDLRKWDKEELAFLLAAWGLKDPMDAIENTPT